MNIKELIDKECKYKLGQILQYNATQFPYYVRIVNRSIVENNVGDPDYKVLSPIEVEYGCIRLGRIDYLVAAEHELEEIKGEN